MSSRNQIINAFFYTGTVGAGLIVLFLTLKETKGMSFEEIQDSLAR